VYGARQTLAVSTWRIWRLATRTQPPLPLPYHRARRVRRQSTLHRVCVGPRFGRRAEFATRSTTPATRTKLTLAPPATALRRPPPTTRSLPTHTTAALLGSHARPPHTADSETTMLWLGKRAELGLHRAGTNLLSDQGRHRHQVHARALTPLPSPAPRNSLASSTRDARSGALSVGTLTHRTVAVLGSAINRPVGELSTRTGRMGVVAGHYRAGA
jgi:hypothetical protein